MTHGTDKHLEHAEHTQHAAHDPFDRRVAMTMTIVAAMLACVTMLSHRSHNETLRLQNEANQLQIEASIHHTEATDQWGYYQAKNSLDRLYRISLAFSRWMTQVTAAAKVAGIDAFTLELSKAEEEWTNQVKKYKVQLPKEKASAESLVDKGKKCQKEAKEKLNESHHAHEKGDRYDLAVLGVEMALILCSVAVLTKQRPFWLSGIGIGLVGIAIAVTGLFGLFMAH